MSANSDFHNRFDKARILARSFGHILSLYSSAIRTITAASSILKSNDPLVIDEFARNCIRSPVAISPTLTKSFQLAAKELYPKEYQKISQSGQPKIKELLNIMNAQELAGILSVTYFYKLLAKSVDAAELAKISPLISAYIKHGAIIGSQLGSSFGRGGGITAAGLRILGLACLIKADLKSFKVLRRMIDDSGELNHLEFERETFGFCHLDVASILAGDLGLGAIARDAFVSFQSPKSQPSGAQAVYWRHTLTESSKLWQEKVALAASNSKKKNAIGEFGDADGFKWLWDKNLTSDILPGVADEDLRILESSAPVRQDPSLSAKAGLNILIIEDEDTSSAMLAKIMNPLGNISICKSAESALDLTNSNLKNRFDLIFLDIGLQGMSGLEFLNIFRQKEEASEISEELSALIFIMTSDETPQTAMQSFTGGANGYITKPLNQQAIFEELEKFGLETPEP